MIILQKITYTHPNKDLLFDDLSLSISKQNKIALIGNNGSGKSTLLKIIAAELQPSGGVVRTGAQPYYIPQLFGQLNELTVAQALKIDDKLKALREILAGSITDANLALLNDDWSIEERSHQALMDWKLEGIDLSQKMNTLSGGQKTKVLLAGISIHLPEIVLLDEPSNHLDREGRKQLYHFIQTTTSTLIIVSHDRKLLNLIDVVYELNKHGITIYGGNYDFYAEQKSIENNALNQELKDTEKALRKAKTIARETAERQQKLDARGKKKKEKEGLPTISMNTFKNNAEKSTSRIKSAHEEKVGGISQDLNELRAALPDTDKMKFGFDHAELHNGKILFSAKNLNFSYGEQALWKHPLHFQIVSGERISLAGLNGSGKTTLIKLILGELDPKQGSVYRADNKSVYIDQDYSLITNQLRVYEQAEKFNHTALLEHEIKIRLNRFLFTKEYWDKSCGILSGGEKMRLMLCCLTIRNKAPDIIVLDEPTNNLDIQNIEILIAAVNDYRGTLIVISHDQYFLEKINVNRTIDLE